MKPIAAASTGSTIMDIGGYLWLIIDVLFVLALGVVMIYGVLAWRRRRRAKIPEDVEKRAVDRAYRE
ncbi:MAG TPA: hypothetical protein VIB38_14530 [Aestuariivirgaceae bacterium]|jgi:uncharacterized iron-regulated membrane protein